MRRISNGLLSGLTIGIFCISTASAADLVGKAPSHAIVQDWSGFYVGGNIGYAWGRAQNNFDLAQPIFAGGNATLTGSDSGNLNGVIAGGQFGYNWQVKNYVLGIEADVQGSDQKTSGIFAGGVGTPWLVGTDATTVTYSEKLNWLSTFRGRLGVTNGPWLLYATGGLAVGKVTTNGTYAFAPSAGGPNAPGSWDQSSISAGWVIGAGIENALSGNWRWKAEYLYVNLGDVSGTAGLAAGNCYGPPAACNGTSGPGTATMTTKFTNQIVRLGLNYKFSH